MERQEELSKLVHDLRGNLHASEMAVKLLQNEAASERQQQFITALTQELAQAKKNLERLVTAVRSTDS